MFYIRRHH